MLKYEYLTITRTIQPTNDAMQLDQLLNERALEGWWLFAIYPINQLSERVVFERTQEKYGHNRNTERVLN